MQKNLKYLICCLFIFGFSIFTQAFSISVGRAALRFSSGGLINVGSGLLLDKLQDEVNKKIESENTSNKKTIPFDNKTKKVSLSDVIGLDDVVDSVNEVLDYLKNPGKYKSLGAKLPKGILLEGAPGTGKTLIARALANESGCSFYSKSASEFVELYVGQGAKSVRELFDKARKDKPAIIFIDELDAVGSARSGTGFNKEHDQTIAELLNQMDGFKQNDSIVVVAATNNLKSLDKALIRSGRFDRVISVPMPDKNSRKLILKHYIQKCLPKFVIDDLKLEELAAKTAGCSGADLEALINESAIAAVRSNASFVAPDHFDLALKKISTQSRLRR